MRILELITPSRLGGAERYFGWSSQEMIKRGHDVVIGLRECEPVAAFYASLGLQVRDLRISGKFNPLAVPRIKVIIEEFKPDVIHTHLSTASQWGLKAAKLAGIRGVGHMHSFNSLGPYGQSDRMIAVSNAVKSHLITNGVSEEKIGVVYPSSVIDISEPAPDIQAMGDSVIACAARLRADKGIRTLLDAFALLQPEFPSAVLVLCGDGSMRTEIEQRARRDNLNVHCLGYRADVPAVFAAAAVAVLPSIRPEGYGMALFEAQAVGTPVVATIAGGTQEAMEDGKSGIAVPPLLPEALAAAIASILEDSAKRDRMSIAALEFASTRTIEESVDALLSELQA